MPEEKQQAMALAEKVLLWTTHPRFDEATREEVRAACTAEQEALSRFGRELSFGTGGLRGILGAGTNRMNMYTVARTTQGLAAFLQAADARSVAIAYDSRNFSREFACIAAGVLARHGIQAYVYTALMPTPMLSFAVRELGCGAGIVITASHNPAEYNGYKVYGADGCQITDTAAEAITGHIEAVKYEDLTWLAEEEARAAGLWEDIPQSVIESYIEKTLACRTGGPEHPLTVVYTPLHGAGLMPVRRVLQHMAGIRYVEVGPQCVPDGNFPTCSKPNPELAQAMEMGLETCRREKAELLLATDPDCDRVGVVVRDAAGEYHILTGNEVGLLLLWHIARARKAAGTLPEDGVVIKTIVTSDLAYAIAGEYGLQVMDMLTGFKYIGEEIGRLEAGGQESRFVFGFEESCGYLAGTHVRDKDGVMACMLVAEMAQSCAARGMTLWDARNALYQTYGVMRNTLLNFDIGGAEPMRVMGETMARLRKTPPAMLGEGPVTVRKDYLLGYGGLPPSNVLAYENAAGCKAIVRPSGTEPKVKVYLSVRQSTGEEADRLMALIAGQVRAWIS